MSEEEVKNGLNTLENTISPIGKKKHPNTKNNKARTITKFLLSFIKIYLSIIRIPFYLFFLKE